MKLMLPSIYNYAACQFNQQAKEALHGCLDFQLGLPTPGTTWALRRRKDRQERPTPLLQL